MGKPKEPREPAAVPAKGEPYVRTAEEQEIVERVVKASRKPRVPTPRINTKPDGEQIIGFNHADQGVAACLLAAKIGADDDRLARHLLVETANTVDGKDGAVDRGNLSYALTIVEGIEPRDTVEALLATQMATVHMASMKAMRYLRDAKTLETQEAASNMANKLMRTFATQAETLKKYRSSGEQTIKVVRVTVNKGGQAVVAGDNVVGGRGTPEIERQPHELCGENAPGAALQSPVEKVGEALPSPGGKGLEGVPLSRGEGRCAEGYGKRRLSPRQTH